MKKNGAREERQGAVGPRWKGFEGRLQFSVGESREVSVITAVQRPKGNKGTMYLSKRQL